MDIPPRERAVRGQKLLRAGLIGPGDEGVHADDEALAIFFDTIARQADARAAKPGTTIAWDFTDAQPWHLTLDGARATATRGLPASADLTLRSSLADFADVTAGRADARRLMLQRRLRPKGSVRLLLGLPSILG
jgi:putative sterol carrier protein